MHRSEKCKTQTSIFKTKEGISMNSSKKLDVKTLTFTALFAALTYVATAIIKIPTPGTGGYIHPGDAIVVLSGIILGPVYGALAAGIGSAMSDLLGGYFLYVPATFIIKAVIAAVVAVVYSKLPASLFCSVRCAVCGIFSTVIVAAGYLIFELFIYGAGALASVPANIVQGVAGFIIAALLLPALQKIIPKEAV